MGKGKKNKSKSYSSYSSGSSYYGGKSSGGIGYGYYGSKYGGYYDDYDDYYGSSDGGYYSGSKGGSSWGSGWSWGSWGGGFDSFEDKDDDLYIKGSESYFTPKAADISSKLDNWSSDTKDNRSLIKEMSRFFYHKMLEDNEYFDEKYKDEKKLTGNQQEQLAYKKMFYQELWDKDVPGYSPLEKALLIFQQLKEKNKSGKMEACDLVEQVSNLKFDHDTYHDPVINELLDTNHFSKARKMQILNKMFLIKNLGSEFKVQKEVEEKRVANSRIVTKKLMRDYSELGNVDLYQRLMPTFNLKLLTKELIVNAPIEKTEHKQKIIALVDYSGSMSSVEKQEWVVALMVDRLKYVIREEAELFFSYFVNDPGWLNFKHVYDRKTAIEFWSQFSTSPNGGDTNLGAMVNRIKDEIECGKLKNLNVDLREERPEILAINDGQDTIKTEGFTYKTNAISLIDGDNSQLRDLCLKNHGKYVYVRTGGDVTTYDKTGQRQMKV